jgi:hypothetical protein
MSEFIKTYPHARQVTLDAVIAGWLGAGGFGAMRPKRDVQATTT